MVFWPHKFLLFFKCFSIQKTTLHDLTIDHEIQLTDLKFGDFLGRGGFGTVFRGKWVSKGLDVALKKVGVPPEACDAKVMAELGKHPNIIGFFGYARSHPDTVIVTALAANGSLYDYLHVNKQIPTQQQSLTWAKQVAYAMAYMHKLGLVHRDLKSSNILFADDMIAQVCDFGTARTLDGTTFASKVSGTLRWMAPEVAVDEAINKMCDVFSFSLVVWELMEHKIPFHDARNELMASMAIMGGKRPPISSAWPDYLSALTKQSWSQNPQVRPSFDDIITSLDNKMYFKR